MFVLTFRECQNVNLKFAGQLGLTINTRYFSDSIRREKKLMN